jgi:hypothetical protein
MALPSNYRNIGKLDLAIFWPAPENAKLTMAGLNQTPSKSVINSQTCYSVPDY